MQDGRLPVEWGAIQGPFIRTKRQFTYQTIPRSSSPALDNRWASGGVSVSVAEGCGSGGGGCLLAVCNDDESAQKAVFRFKELGAKEAFQINLIEG